MDLYNPLSAYIYQITIHSPGGGNLESDMVHTEVAERTCLQTKNPLNSTSTLVSVFLTLVEYIIMVICKLHFKVYCSAQRNPGVVLWY
jgi:hypothetical protein